MNKTKSVTKIISVIMAILIASSAMSLTVSSAPSPEAPAKISVERSTSAIKLSWSKVSGANGYRIYYKLPGDLTWRAVVKSTTATSHTLKKLPEGQSYLFAVRSYTKSGDKTVWGGYTQIATATKTVAPKKVTATQSGSSVKLSWSEVESATGYRIYYKTSAKASWKTLVGSTKKTKYTVKDLKAGTNYMFAVRSYVKSSLGTFLGKYKTVDLTVKPTTPSLDVATTGNKSVKLSWSKVDADGYRVYYKVGNSSWKTAVSKTTKTSYLFNNLTYGKNYTFAVKAYVKTGSKVIWSGYNTVGYYCREMITTTTKPQITTRPTTTRPTTTRPQTTEEEIIDDSTDRYFIDQYQELVKSGKFLMKVKDPEHGDIVVAKKGNKEYIEATKEGIYLKMIYNGVNKKGKAIEGWSVVIPDMGIYSPMPEEMVGDINVEELTKDFATGDTDVEYTVDVEEITYNGEKILVTVESRVDENGNMTKYYFNGDVLIRSDSISPSGAVSTTEFSEISADVPDSLFQITQTKVDISYLLNSLG